MKKRNKLKKGNLRAVAGRAALLSLGVLAACSSRVYAAAPAGGFSSVTNAIGVLKTGLFGVIAGVGVIILGKNIMEAATAFQQQDSAGLNNAIKGIIAGGLMAAVGSIVTAMGFV